MWGYHPPHFPENLVQEEGGIGYNLDDFALQISEYFKHKLFIDTVIQAAKAQSIFKYIYKNIQSAKAIVSSANIYKTVPCHLVEQM
jgi:hypothetical protein